MQFFVTNTIIIILIEFFDLTQNLILTKLIENKVVIFFIILLLSGILSRVHLIK